MRARSRLTTGLLALLLLTLVVTAGTIAPEASQSDEEADSKSNSKAPDGVLLVSVDNQEERLWPYTSRQRDFQTRTLPINVIITEDAGTTRQVLAADEQTGWTAKNAEGEAVTLNGSGVVWSESEGATRYTYVQNTDGGEWIDETSQVHDGHYLGARTHIRMYEVTRGEDTWTALQAHEEYWDWFMLRHRVGSVARGRYLVEHQFYGTGLLADISRQRFGNGGVLDADGWVTIIDLVDWKLRTGESPTTGGAATAGVLVGLLAARDRLQSLATEFRTEIERSGLTLAHVGMASALVAAPVGVRIVAVTLEQMFPGMSPKMIAAPCYFALAVGIPLTAATFGRLMPSDDAFAVAAVALGAGFLLDYAHLGIGTLAIDIVIHRLVLLAGLGLIAAGGVRWTEIPSHRHRYRAVGIAVWVGALLWPLAGL